MIKFNWHQKLTFNGEYIIKSIIILISLLCTLLVSSGFAQLTFTENSVAAGVDDGGAGQGISFGDYNNDGLMDIYVVNHPSAQLALLYMNNGDGTFTETAVSAGVSQNSGAEGAVWFDHDKNGYIDLYIANEAGTNALMHNNGDGTFTDVSSATGADNSGSLPITNLLADFNNDGAMDIYIVTLSGPNMLLQGDINGNFTAVGNAGVGNTGRGLTGGWGDFNGDGYADLYVINDGANVMYRNNGDGTFTDVTSASGTASTLPGYGGAVGDFDNDGDFDIYVSNWGANQLFQNDGSGVFTNVAATAGVDNSLNALGVSFGDLDNDGDLDIYLVNDNGANVLYINDGSGIFGDSTASAGVADALGIGQGTAFADLDNDGDLDIYVTNLNQPNMLYINDGNSNHYLNVVLAGIANDANGIGSVIIIYTGATSQTKMVEGGGGFSSHNSLPVEFGLGSSVSVDSIKVKWPYGREQIVVPTAIDTTIIITEDIYEHDMIVSSISGIPTAEMIVDGDSIFPSATIGNIGDSTETNYYLILTITSDGVTEYQDSISIANPLASFEFQDVEFAAWVPSEEDTFEIELLLGLDSDQSLINNMLNASSRITFAVPPTILSVNPGDGGTDVSAGLVLIDAIFSESIDESFVNSANFSAVGSVSGDIPGIVLYQDAAQRLAILISNSFDFASEEVVTVTVSGNFESLLGLTLDGNSNGVGEGSPTDDFVWSFTIETIIGVDDEYGKIPQEYVLSQNHPNPFNPVTSIEFAIPKDGEISLTLYDINGREIEKLATGIFRAGYHSIDWDASNLSSGIYFYRLNAPGYVDTKKMILLK